MPVPAFPIRPAEHMFQGSAGRPANSNPWARLAFYNIGWLAASKKERHTKEGLATEICIMVRDKGVDAVGICEVFNLKDDMRDKREIIMQHLVTKLNSTSCDMWAGRSDGHYIFLWNSRKLVLRKYDYVSCGVEEHPWRMAQYFQLHRAQLENDSPLHVCHNHSPSSRPNCTLTDERRKVIFGTLWNYVLQQDPGASSLPVAIFAGDFNCVELQWIQCLQRANFTQASRRSVQMCVSKKNPEHGDQAMVQ